VLTHALPVTATPAARTRDGALVWFTVAYGPTFLRLPRARLNAASEHLLAWCLEERTGRHLLHGEIVCLSVLLMAHLQENAPELAAATIGAAGVPVQPAAIGTTWAEVEAARLALPEYARDVVPWHTVVDHDANHLARLCPIGMLFVACRDGRSHCPEEWAEPAHLAAGSRVMLELVLRLDAALSELSPTP
jgi:Peptidase family M20/M25/M40